jgi:hypothetical protein
VGAGGVVDLPEPVDLDRQCVTISPNAVDQALISL